MRKNVEEGSEEEAVMMEEGMWNWMNGIKGLSYSVEFHV